MTFLKVVRRNFSISYNLHLTPAVNRQSGFRRETRRAFFLYNVISFRSGTMLCRRRHYIVCFMKNQFFDSSNMSINGINVSKAEIDSI